MRDSRFSFLQRHTASSHHQQKMNTKAASWTMNSMQSKVAGNATRHYNDSTIESPRNEFARQHCNFQGVHGEVQACPYGNIAIPPYKPMDDDLYP